jgi:hypothetical protein
MTGDPGQIALELWARGELPWDEVQPLLDMRPPLEAEPVDPAKPLLDSLFPEQRAFVEDQSPFLLSFCTRRAAKSYAQCVKLIIAGQKNPNSSNLYLAITRDEAKRMVWEPILKELDRKFSLGITFNESYLIATLPNRSRIYLIGVDQEKEARKLLGQKLPMVAIDECQDIRSDLHHLIHDILKPSVAECRGQISLSGTPSSITSGYFYEVTTGKHEDAPLYSRHRWSWKHNRHVREAIEDEIRKMVAKLPRYMESPQYRRQYDGQWVVYTDELCYHYSETFNVFGALPMLPASGWTTVLGVDTGLVHASGITVVSWHEFDPHLYIRYSDKRPGLDITALSEWIHRIKDEFHPDREVCDPANAQGVAELNRRHGHYLQPADKRDKTLHMKLMTADLESGRILVDPARCGALTEEWASLIWDQKAKRAGLLVEDPTCANDASDSALYSWRTALNYLSEEQKDRPKPGTDAYAATLLKAQETEIRDNLLRWKREKEFERDLTGLAGLEGVL